MNFCDWFMAYNSRSITLSAGQCNCLSWSMVLLLKDCTIREIIRVVTYILKYRYLEKEILNTTDYKGKLYQHVSSFNKKPTEQTTKRQQKWRIQSQHRFWRHEVAELNLHDMANCFECTQEQVDMIMTVCGGSAKWWSLIKKNT